ncbi:MAG: hypothetical protein OXB86_02800, partial [Bdellovibrionales bacterium]|nr:hypothetical protein [Bdellovibrionales bacterium]
MFENSGYLTNNRCHFQKVSLFLNAFCQDGRIIAGQDGLPEKIERLSENGNGYLLNNLNFQTRS